MSSDPKMDTDFSRYSLSDINSIIDKASPDELCNFANTELAAMLRVYGFTGHPGRMAPEAHVNKNLLLELANRLCGLPLCKDKDCAPPCQDKTSCEFYDNGFCTAVSDTHKGVIKSAGELRHLIGKYVYWDDPCGGEVLLKDGWCVPLNHEGTYSFDWMLSHGTIYRHKVHAAMNGINVGLTVCPDCHRIMSYDSHFRNYRCAVCGYMPPEGGFQP